MLKDLNIEVPNINERDRVPMEAIQAVVDFIAQTFDPAKIILFGSYAYGEPKPWSDVDLLVVKETDNPKQVQMDINLSFQHPFGMDIMVRTPQEITERIAAGDFFLREIITKGRTVYEEVETDLFQDIVDMADTEADQNHVLEWVQKAEGDFLVATDLLSLGREPTTDAICFHCQQCVEKYGKAYLLRQGILFPRTHDLIELWQLCERQEEDFTNVLPEMRILNNYSVETRSPGRFTSFEEAESAVQAMETVRTFIRIKLNLEETEDSEDIVS